MLSPVPKPGKNPNNTEGYRPISLLPAISKVLDRIFSQRLWKHCHVNIANEQHAYLPNRGVFTLCHQLESRIKENVRKNKHSVVLSEDLEKSFDKVGNFAVIHELHKWGVPKNLLKLVKSFLSHRKILVRVDGFLSSSCSMKNGVPQGSPLSVVLYTAYVNSLFDRLKGLNGIDHISIYADNIFIIASGSHDITTSLNRCDAVINEWTKDTGATIPINKCEAIHVCKKIQM